MPYELLLFFFLIAMLYASVGFGGGSSYLALLSLYSFEYQFLKLTALLCNIVVVSGGVYIFYKKGFIKWKKIIPLVIVSVPLAFLGGKMRLEESTFFVLLGLTLCISGLMVFIVPKKPITEQESSDSSNITSASIGGGIGFLSGLVGIGGGIFLAPVLHLMRWETPKIIAATASFFILVNSLAGISGQLSNGYTIPYLQLLYSLMIAVFLGGQIGSRLGAGIFSPNLVRRLTAVLIMFVGLRLLFKYISF